MYRRIKMRNEEDRPTQNTLQYLTRVRPHHIHREDWLIDPFAYDTLSHTLGVNVVEEFGEYTRSYYTLEGHYQNLWNYDRRILTKPTDCRLQLAIERARSDFKLDAPVTAFGYNELASVPFISSSSAGWNMVGKKGDPGNHEHAIRNAVLSINMWLEDQINGTSHFRFHPDLAWTRTQLGTVEDPKIRNVWGTSFGNIILEGTSAYPLIVAYRRKGAPMAVGMNYYKRLPSMIHSCLFENEIYKTAVALDVKSFDSSIQPWLINEAFDILKENIIFKDAMSINAFNYSRFHFITRPVVMPDGRLWLKKLGIPSGSYYTQLIGSICNLILCYYAQVCHYGQMFKTFVLGDDSLFGVPVEFGIPNIKDFAQYYAALGTTLHPDKGVVTQRAEDVDFLGHCAYHLKVDRETAALLRLALYPEHPVQGPAQSINRIKGILLDSALNSWPVIHLHQTMIRRFREYIMESKLEDQFIGSDKDWLISVLDVTNPPSDINEVTTFMLT